jgi:hypothetical protein
MDLGFSNADSMSICFHYAHIPRVEAMAESNALEYVIYSRSAQLGVLYVTYDPIHPRLD